MYIVLLKADENVAHIMTTFSISALFNIVSADTEDRWRLVLDDNGDSRQDIVHPDPQ